MLYIFLRKQERGESIMSRFSVRKGFFLIVLLVITMSTVYNQVEENKKWISPDGKLKIFLHNKWVQGDLKKTKIYDVNATQAIPGAFFQLFVGGLPQRYITLSVYPALKGGEISSRQLVDITIQQLRQQGFDVLEVQNEKQGKSYVHYRFTHSGDPVSQVLIAVQVSIGIYMIEINSPRKDEKMLLIEAQNIFKNINIIE